MKLQINPSNYTTNCKSRQKGAVCSLAFQERDQRTLCEGSKEQRLLAKPFLLYKNRNIYLYTDSRQQIILQQNSGKSLQRPRSSSQL